MRRHTNGTRKHDPLQQAIILLMNNQALMLAQQAETNKSHEEFKRKHAEDMVEWKMWRIESEARFKRIERELDEIRAVLIRHEEMLNSLTAAIAKLPEAVLSKIGFKPR
jgi:hypothetical protein